MGLQGISTLPSAGTNTLAEVDAVGPELKVRKIHDTRSDEFKEQLLPQALKEAANWELQCYVNPNLKTNSEDAPLPYPSDLPLQAEANKKVREFTRNWKRYAKTELITAGKELASAVGVASILVKDETSRCGLTSFKGLGGGIAVLMEYATWEQQCADALAKGEASPLKPHFITCSAGNHGVGVALGAAECGCEATIFVAKNVPESRTQLMIAQNSALIHIERVASDQYIDAVYASRALAREGRARGIRLVQDGDYSEGAYTYKDIPQRIFGGYTIIAQEICEQVQEMRVAGDLQSYPTHIVINCGVGGLACGVFAHVWQHYADLGECPVPLLVTAEPTNAKAIMHSLEEFANSAGDAISESALSLPMHIPKAGASTVQAGLDCKQATAVTLAVLKQSTYAAVAINDEVIPTSIELMQKYCNLPVGESAVAGLAAVIAASQQREHSDSSMSSVWNQLKLNKDSVIVLIACEGPTQC